MRPRRPGLPKAAGKRRPARIAHPAGSLGVFRGDQSRSSSHCARGRLPSAPMVRQRLHTMRGPKLGTHVIRPAIGAQHRRVMAEPARHERRADAVLAHVAEGHRKQGTVVADSRVDLARSSIGVAVRAGAPKPDVSSVDALRSALLAAKSIAYPDSENHGYQIRDHVLRSRASPGCAVFSQVDTIFECRVQRSGVAFQRDSTCGIEAEASYSQQLFCWPRPECRGGA